MVRGAGARGSERTHCTRESSHRCAPSRDFAGVIVASVTAERLRRELCAMRSVLAVARDTRHVAAVSPCRRRDGNRLGAGRSKLRSCDTPLQCYGIPGLYLDPALYLLEYKSLSVLCSSYEARV